MRKAVIERRTAETDIKLVLNIDGSGVSNINSGCGFLDHMLTLFAKHGRFDLDISCKGDVSVDYHHTTEDIGICLGQAFSEALSDRKGINRYGSVIIPMDEALVLASVDISGRGYLGYTFAIPTDKVGDFDTELAKEFWLAFIRTSECTLHLKQLDGENSHHIIECTFKAAARALRQAAAVDADFPDDIPSTKGVL